MRLAGAVRLSLVHITPEEAFPRFFNLRFCPVWQIWLEILVIQKFQIHKARAVKCWLYLKPQTAVAQILYILPGIFLDCTSLENVFPFLRNHNCLLIFSLTLKQGLYPGQRRDCNLSTLLETTIGLIHTQYLFLGMWEKSQFMYSMNRIKKNYDLNWFKIF